MLLIKRRFISRVFVNGSSTIGVNAFQIVIKKKNNKYTYLKY